MEVRWRLRSCRGETGIESQMQSRRRQNAMASSLHPWCLSTWMQKKNCLINPWRHPLLIPLNSPLWGLKLASVGKFGYLRDLTVLFWRKWNNVTSNNTNITSEQHYINFFPWSFLFIRLGTEYKFDSFFFLNLRTTSIIQLPFLWFCNAGDSWNSAAVEWHFLLPSVWSLKEGGYHWSNTLLLPCLLFKKILYMKWV